VSLLFNAIQWVPTVLVDLYAPSWNSWFCILILFSMLTVQAYTLNVVIGIVFGKITKGLKKRKDEKRRTALRAAHINANTKSEV
jgi:hypothetical protein